ncbi:hypothetical protein CCR75_009836 [Bremia lactucae]|uniref:Uncharacterized protein n=1 Tax=Bremia lactucae TaxID=4779 RepID=A0A976FPQ3_BRELC|nr:hypothetical protein CCR75_009836 [Bremia lactucae]
MQSQIDLDVTLRIDDLDQGEIVGMTSCPSDDGEAPFPRERVDTFETETLQSSSNPAVLSFALIPYDLSTDAHDAQAAARATNQHEQLSRARKAPLNASAAVAAAASPSSFQRTRLNSRSLK